MTVAVVTGITGQDGAYLVRELIGRGWEVHGTYRRGSSTNFWRLDELGMLGHERLHMVEYDLLEPGGAYRLIERTRPTHVFNIAAQSFVGVSFQQPVATSLMTGLGAVHLLEAIRDIAPSAIRFYQASSSEMFGKVQAVPQNEATPFYPRSPYAAAKLFAHWMTVNYRESYGIFATSGILFNHESPLRGREFVTRKISNAVAQISLGQLEVLSLGNLDAERDWGYAPEYVEGMVRIIEHDTPETYVLATGQTHTVRRFTELAFRAIGVEIAWHGSDENEVGVDVATGKVRVAIDPVHYRPAEVDFLQGDCTKASTELGWSAKTSLEQLCAMMVEADVRRNRQHASF